MEALVRERYHGAANIRGILFQMLCSIFKVLELKNDEVFSVRFEGVEDIDVLDLRGSVGKNNFIQVKWSSKPWTWSQVKSVFSNFYDVYRKNQDACFELLVNFELKKDLEKLTRFSQIGTQDRKRLVNKCRNIFGVPKPSIQEVEAFLSKIAIRSISDEEIRVHLKRKLAEDYGLNSDIVDVYLRALLGRFLEWAGERKTILRSDIDRIHESISTAIANERFNAPGQGLISYISWKPDASPEDFIDAKPVRPGHIVAGLDVRRTDWLALVEQAVRKSRICVIRGPSGHGKSTLLFRYARDFWPGKNTLVIHVCETDEQVQSIIKYLQFLKNYLQPFIVLLDNVGSRTKKWPELARECLTLDFCFLMSVRQEDWHRYGRENIGQMEILDPTFNIEDAKEIYRVLANRGRVHETVESAEWAYEMLDQPALILEYVFLISHGKMLRDLLSDQIRIIVENREDKAKIELLRRVSVADTYGVGLLVDELEKTVEFDRDQYKTIESMQGEYLRTEEGTIYGLHPVRSSHIAELLHNDLRNRTTTAILNVSSVQSDSLPDFISNCLVDDRIDVEKFKQKLIELKDLKDPVRLTKVLDGLYDAGERMFIREIKPTLDLAWEHSGSAGASFVSALLGPSGDRLRESFEKAASTLKEGEDATGGENLNYLIKLSRVPKSIPKGVEFFVNFLKDIPELIGSVDWQKNPNRLAKIIEMGTEAGISFPRSEELIAEIFNSDDFFEMGSDALCEFLFATYRHNQGQYLDWFQKNQETLLSYLKYHTDCLSVELSDETLTICFVVKSEDEKPNIAAWSRLEKWKSALPFLKTYKTKPIWLVPLGLSPPVPDAEKSPPAENLFSFAQKARNSAWSKLTREIYLPDSYNKYLKYWDLLRRTIIEFVSDLCVARIRAQKGKESNPNENFDTTIIKIKELLKNKPDPPKQLLSPLRESVTKQINPWETSFSNFFRQLLQYIKSEFNDENMKRLAHRNLLDCVKHLPAMHDGFESVFKISPDYFRTRDLNKLEIEKFSLMVDVIEAWLIYPPASIIYDVRAYAKEIRDAAERTKLRKLKARMVEFEKQGIEFVYPDKIYVDYPINYIALAFSVETIGLTQKYRLKITEALESMTDIAECFLLVPLLKSKRFVVGYYTIYSSFLEKTDEERE